MPLICVKCEVELKCSTSGTTVVENAQFGAYRVWMADTYKCPGCGMEVVSGFANRPALQHWEEGFAEKFKRVFHNARRVVQWNERPKSEGGVSETTIEDYVR